jgi:hypothetical protein
LITGGGMPGMKDSDTKANFRLSRDELKKLKIFCLQNNTTLQDFLYHLMEYGIKNKILPGDKK